MLFDCDGTLVDSELIAAAVTAELLGARGVPLDAAAVLESFTGLSAASTKTLVAERFGVVLGPDFDADKRARLDAAFTAGLRAVPGVPGLLAALAGAGRPMCVASSSSPQRIDHSLATASLDAYFPPARRFSAAMVERGKPAPDLFLLAASRLGAGTESCTVVEDSPYGVEAGVAGGMTVIGFTGAAHASPDLVGRLDRAGATAVAADATGLARLLDQAGRRRP